MKRLWEGRSFDGVFDHWIFDDCWIHN